MRMMPSCWACLPASPFFTYRVGATAHYITTDLDGNPIIEQGVERVDHTMKPADLEWLGQDVESIVLNRAVRWHAEHRVFENGNRTVVLKH